MKALENQKEKINLKKIGFIKKEVKEMKYIENMKWSDTHVYFWRNNTPFSNFYKTEYLGTSLVGQWLRIHLQMQGDMGSTPGW